VAGKSKSLVQTQKAAYMRVRYAIEVDPDDPDSPWLSGGYAPTSEEYTWTSWEVTRPRFDDKAKHVELTITLATEVDAVGLSVGDFATVAEAEKVGAAFADAVQAAAQKEIDAGHGMQDVIDAMEAALQG
jgi:hypothetical protein